MKILLISPCMDPWTRTPKGAMVPQLSLYIIAGLTPAEYEVKIVEEEEEAIDLDEECDLVGISCMTANAPRAYFVASEFRRRGKIVVLGGIHPTILPEEAAEYADTVVIGEVENIWEELLDDFMTGNLKKFYKKEPPDLNRYISIKYKGVRKRLFKVIPVMTTRGCPYSCEFCSVGDIYGKKIRHTPIENIVRYIIESGAKNFFFLDDNIIGDTDYAKELFRAIKPLKIKWGGQASVKSAIDIKLMKLASESGCCALFFGVESISETQLKRMKKTIGDISKIKEVITKMRELGILFHASLVFGFDDETDEVFPDTLAFLLRNKIASASFNILTPYPGTKIYNMFKEEGRLLSNKWKYYGHSTCVFRPKNMTPYELQRGKIWVKKEFSKMSNILRRFPTNLSHPLLYLSLNITINKKIKFDYNELESLKDELYIPTGGMPNKEKVINY